MGRPGPVPARRRRDRHATGQLGYPAASLAPLPDSAQLCRQRGVDGQGPELVARLLKSPGQHAGARQQLRGHLAKGQPEHRFGHAQGREVRAAQDVMQRRRELAVGDRVGRGQVVRARPRCRIPAESGSPGPRRRARSSSSPGNRCRTGGAARTGRAAAGASARRRSCRGRGRCAGGRRGCPPRPLARPLPPSRARRRDRNPCPAGVPSVTSRPPASPYQPIAEADDEDVSGGRSSLAEHARERAGGEYPAGPDLRLVRRGPAAVGDPGPGQVHASVEAVESRAKPQRRRGSGNGGAYPASAGARIPHFSAARGGRRTRLMTSWPSARRLAASALPISPDEPVTATFIRPGPATAPVPPRTNLLPACS